MEVFLVRHGETGGNVAQRHQAEVTQLSPNGQVQARKVAELIKQYKPTHLVTSNLVRAIETARVIGEVCDLVPETSEDFVELVRPKYLYGHHHGSLKSVWFYFQWYLGIKSIDLAEGESYQALRNRFKEAQNYLSQFPADGRVVVVSHSVFMNLFTAHLCRDKSLSPLKAALVFRKILTIPNGQIIPLVFDDVDKGEACAWSINK